MDFTGDELNFLVYRYLQESGFKHSAFVFGLESQLSQSNIEGALVPPSALISIVQKGLYYSEAEICVEEDGSGHSLPSGLSLIGAIMPDIVTSLHKTDEDKSDSQKTNGKGIARKKIKEQNASIEIPLGNISILKGHNAEVFSCTWHPTADKLASGSGDCTARIWDLNYCSHLILSHHTKRNKSKLSHSQDVTTLNWSENGQFLATGSFDGCAKIWNQDGSLSTNLGRHRGAIFALKWNKLGNYVLTGGVDKTNIIWNAEIGNCYRQFEFHTGPVLDVDWKSNECFATCGADKLIYVLHTNLNDPIKSFRGHSNEINSIEWNPQGNLLASCSDDMTVKLWTLTQTSFVRNLKGHNGKIFKIKWGPMGPGTNNPNMNVLLASASFDSTIRLWNVECGVPLHTLKNHIDHIYSVAFSPDGKFLASGSLDKSVYIWSSQSGQLIRSYKATGGIYEVSWNCRGDKVCASADDGNVFVIDLRFL